MHFTTYTVLTVMLLKCSGILKLNNEVLFDQEMGGIKQKDANIERETYMQVQYADSIYV